MKNLLCNRKFPWMLKCLHGTTDANKEPLFLRVTTFMMLCLTFLFYGKEQREHFSKVLLFSFQGKNKDF